MRKSSLRFVVPFVADRVASHHDAPSGMREYEPLYGYTISFPTSLSLLKISIVSLYGEISEMQNEESSKTDMFSLNVFLVLSITKYDFEANIVCSGMV